MKISDFKIGTEFVFHNITWRCTDVGTHTIAVIQLDGSREDWDGRCQEIDRATSEAAGDFNGPPYNAVEYLFDECEIYSSTPVIPDHIVHSVPNTNDTFDCFAVDLVTHRIRRLESNRVRSDAEAVITVAAMRRGVKTHCFVVAPFGCYQDGELWEG